jgi:quinol monooxygenase YgiN
MKVIVTAKWLIKPGKEQAWIDLVRSLLKPSSSESGCISYTMYKGIYEPNTFFFFEEWQDDAAFEQHLVSPHVNAALQVVAEQAIAEGEPVITRYTIEQNADIGDSLLPVQR